MESGGALEVQLHPLVLINISDHVTRSTYNESSGRVLGAILGTQSGRSVEIHNSFELIPDGPQSVNWEYLKQKQDQFKKVYEDYELLGWYSIGSKPTDDDILVHKQLLDINENPLYLMVDVYAAFQIQTKDLPVHLYETAMQFINDQPTMVFVEISYTISTAEAERVGVDHIAHLSAPGTGDSSEVNVHLLAMHGTTKMLNIRLKVLLSYLRASIDNKVPVNHNILREIGLLKNLLPAANSEAYTREFMREFNDALLISYLTTTVDTANSISEMFDKFSVGYDRSHFGSSFGRRRGGGGFFI